MGPLGAGEMELGLSAEQIAGVRAMAPFELVPDADSIHEERVVRDEW